MSEKNIISGKEIIVEILANTFVRMVSIKKAFADNSKIV